MGAVATNLASIAAAAYNGDLAGLPSGFAPLSIGGAVNGVYLNENAAATVVTGELNGTQVLVLAFRGSDDRQDWLNNFYNINADYAKFAGLVSAVEDYAAQNKLAVVVSGPSLGAALAQVFMAEHPADGEVSYQAVTFGSPGALIPEASDPRITNYAIADDLIPYTGEYRALIGQKASSDPFYAEEVALVGSYNRPSISADDVRDAIPAFTVNYVNRGADVILPDSDGQVGLFAPDQILSRGSLIQLAYENADRHDASLYVAESAAASDPTTYTGTSGSDVAHLWSLYDTFNFGAGLDAVAARGARSEYTITRNENGSILVTDTTASRDGADQLSDLERITFSDSALAFDVAGTAGLAYRLYEVFDRSPDISGLTWWVQTADAGASAASIAAAFLASSEFATLYGPSLSDQEFVSLLYRTVLDRDADTGGLSYWIGDLQSGRARSEVLVSFTESAENVAQENPSLQGGIVLGQGWDLVA